MTIEEAFNKMMTCATAPVCAREEACFRVVTWAKEKYAEQLREEKLSRAEEEAKRQEEEVVEHYVPQWPVMAMQWEMARIPDEDAM